MTQAISVLIVSNGHGEDTVGALLARRLTAGGVTVSAYPLVGSGDAYHGTRLLEPRRTFPSGGFGLRGSWKHGLADLRAGLLSHWRAQRSTLTRERGGHAMAVAIGDAYCLWMTGQAADQCFFVATAKSAYMESHGWIEHRIMKRATTIWTRDEFTARTLARRGLPAQYDGNPMMDAIPEPDGNLPLPAGAPVILLLPGSRADSLANVMLLLKVALRVSASKESAFVCALPPSLQLKDVNRAASAKGWVPDGDYLRSNHTSVLLTRKFGSALEASTIAIGLAGTANEQAAGLGKSVVSFAPPGAVQFTPTFLSLQKRLLGNALIATEDWESAAAAAAQLLSDPSERSRRGEIGKARMGSRGSIEAIAHAIRSVSPWGSGTLRR